MKKKLIALLLMVVGSLMSMEKDYTADPIFSSNMVKRAIEDAAFYDPENYGEQTDRYRQAMRVFSFFFSVKKDFERWGLDVKSQTFTQALDKKIKESALDNCSRAIFSPSNLNLIKKAENVDKFIMNVLLNAAAAQQKFERVHGRIEQDISKPYCKRK